jgi:hypothetical protein
VLPEKAKSFLVLFFKKEQLSFFAALSVSLSLRRARDPGQLRKPKALLAVPALPGLQCWRSASIKKASWPGGGN